ncbi:MAG: PD-(D/E)XK nuclease family protein [Planctomycetota bacterium]
MKLFPEIFCKRIFLGWDRPLLPAVIDSFLDSVGVSQDESSSRDHAANPSPKPAGKADARDSQQLDLSDWIFALPTLWSVRRFESLLEQRCDARGIHCNTPRLITAGELPELLYRPRKTLAIEFEQTLAWSAVLRSLPRDQLAPLMPNAPEEDATAAWLELASTLRRLSTDLASHGKSFIDVLAIAETPQEQRRWNLLGRLHTIYLKRLEEAGRSDVHDQRRRAAAREAIHSHLRIALVGTSDLNESVASVLTEVDQQIVSFVAAPESEAGRFDWLGRFRTESFLDFELAIKDEHLVAADDIADQGACVENAVSTWVETHKPRKVTVGITDPSQLVPVEMSLSRLGLKPFRQVGWTIEQTSVGKLLAMTHEFVKRQTWRSFAALVRHPDVLELLVASDHMTSTANDIDKPICLLDQLIANHFPVHLSEPLPAEAQDKYPEAIQYAKKLQRFLADFVTGDASDPSRRSLSLFSKALLKWLDTVYRTRLNDSNSRSKTKLAYEKSRELLKRFSSLTPNLDLSVTADAALETLINRIAELRVVLEQDTEATRVHGWLDLALDDSPAVLVVGMNHPFVPASITNDPFLPGEMRTRLRVADNERRYARDLYAMHLLIASRTNCKFIVGKKSADGTPTPPSRLLSAMPLADLPRRIRALQSPGGNNKPLEKPAASVYRTEIAIPSFDLTEDCPVKAMSVTAFKSYLECPYRFYLRHVLKLRPIDDASRELAANQFGDLVHGALEAFGLSKDKEATSEEDIFESLRHHLNEYASHHFGLNCERSVILQVRQAEQRLRAAATEQAKRINGGWTIHAVEASVAPDQSTGITVDGRRMPLAGRFDRIDYHADTGTWAILDYKTHGHPPEKKHLRLNSLSGKEEWIDLQLPLYRLMIPDLNIQVDDPANVQLGYFNVAEKPAETRINLAQFSEPLLADAEALIEDCVRRIFAGDFHPSPEGVTFDDYGMILQTGIASRMLADFAVIEQDEEAVLA